GIAISVTLAATPDAVNGGQKMTITVAPPAENRAAQLAHGPYSPEYLDGLALREGELELRCSIPIGTTGFVLKKVGGKIILDSQSTTIQLEAEVATAAKVLIAPILSAEGTVTLVADPF